MPFKPGQSGNPSGSPRRINEAARKCREYTDKALQALIRALDDAKAENQIKAATALLDRGWGRPQEYIELSTDPDAPPTVEVNLRQKILAHVPSESLTGVLAEYELARPEDHT